MSVDSAARGLAATALTTMVASISALQAYSGPLNTINVNWYSTVGDNGGGMFVWHATSTATADGGTIVASTPRGSTGRWIRQYSGPVDIRWFGAQTYAFNSSAENTAAINNALAVSGYAYISPDEYHHSGTINFNSQGMTLLGSGLNNTIVKYTGTGTAWLFNYPQGAPCSISELSVRGSVAIGSAPALGSTIGFYLGGKSGSSYWNCTNVRVEQFDYGVWLGDNAYMVGWIGGGVSSNMINMKWAATTNAGETMRFSKMNFGYSGEVVQALSAGLQFSYGGNFIFDSVSFDASRIQCTAGGVNLRFNGCWFEWPENTFKRRNYYIDMAVGGGAVVALKGCEIIVLSDNTNTTSVTSAINAAEGNLFIDDTVPYVGVGTYMSTGMTTGYVKLSNAVNVIATNCGKVFNAPWFGGSTTGILSHTDNNGTRTNSGPKYKANAGTAATQTLFASDMYSPGFSNDTMQILKMTGTLGAGSSLQPSSVATIVSAQGGGSANNFVANHSWVWRIINASAGAYTWTLIADAGATWALTGTMTIPQNTFGDVLITLLTPTTGTIVRIN